MRRLLSVLAISAGLFGLLTLGTDSTAATHPRDGCSVPAKLVPFLGGNGDTPFGFDFAVACLAHDTCYATWAGYASFNACNQQFENDLDIECATRQGAWGTFCRRVADAYDAAVTVLGWDSYVRRQDEHMPVLASVGLILQQLVDVAAGDFGWIRIDVPAGGGRMEIALSIVGGNGDLDVHLYAPWHEFIYSRTRDTSRTLALENPTPGIYWLGLGNEFSLFTKKTAAVVVTLR